MPDHERLPGKGAGPAVRVPARILALVGGTVALAAVATLRAWEGTADGNFWFWFTACLAGELLWVRLPVGNATVSMASCFHFAALLLLPRGQAMAIAALSGVLGESVFMGKPPLRAIFNGAQAALAVGAASLVLGYAGAGRGVPDLVYGSDPLPLLAAGLMYFVVNTGFVSLAVALSERIRFLAAWRANFGGRYELLSNGAMFSLGALLASHYAMNGMTGTLLVALPLFVAYEGYRRMKSPKAATPASEERLAA